MKKKGSIQVKQKDVGIPQGIPEGMDPDEYFSRLGETLRAAGYGPSEASVPIDEDSNLSKLLEIHHQQALQQSSVQFTFSLASAVVGFVFIITMVAITALSKDAAWYEYIAKIVPGAIIEAVSALFFTQARETRDRATKFFRELNCERQITKSIGIADTI